MRLTQKDLFNVIYFFPPLLFLSVPLFPRILSLVFLVHLFSWFAKTLLEFKVKTKLFNRTYSILHITLIAYLTYEKLSALVAESFDERYLFIELFYIFILFLTITLQFAPTNVLSSSKKSLKNCSMNLKNKLIKMKSGTLIITIAISIFIWMLFALFLPGYSSSKSESINILTESFFVAIIIVLPLGILYGIYKLFFYRK